MDNDKYRQKNEHSLRDADSSYVSLQCVVLLVILVIILGVLNLVSSNITRLLRPVFMVACLAFPSFGYYRLDNYKWLITIVVYYLIIFLAYPITRNSFEVFFSLETFALFFLFVGNKVWTSREISLIFKTVCVACAFEATVILISNPGLLRSSSSQHISYFSATLNRNPASFSITPGALCGMILMFYDHSEKHRFAFFGYGLLTLLSVFTVFCLGCRSAFFSLTIGVFLIAWDAVGRGSVSGRMNRRVLLLVASVAILLLSSHYASGSYSERLFAIGEKMDDSGRADIWKDVWDYILINPVFGGGYDNWPPNLDMSTHNSFLTVMLYSGMLGGVLMAIVMVSFGLETIKTRSCLPVAMMVEAFLHSYSEANFDYYAYIPLCLGVVLLRFMEYQHRDPSMIFTTTGYPTYDL